jgi:fructose-bisphosphate aldolase, class I
VTPRGRWSPATRACWRWMKAIQPATNDLPNWEFPRPRKPGAHTLERCYEVTEEVLRAVFDQLYSQRVALEGMLLKPDMVLPGLSWPPQVKVKEVAIGEQQYQVGLTDRNPDEVEEVDELADATVSCLLRAVPAAVPGIAFLSGGQSAELALARLNALNTRFKSRLPWALAFSFARAIQQPALEIWRGSERPLGRADTSPR